MLMQLLFFIFLVFSKINYSTSTEINSQSLDALNEQELSFNSNKPNSSLYSNGALSYFMYSLLNDEFYGRWYKWNSYHNWYLIPLEEFSIFPFFLTNTHTSYVQNSILKLCIFPDVEKDSKNSCLKFPDLLSLINNGGIFDQQNMTIKLHNTLAQIDNPKDSVSSNDGCVVNATLRFIDKVTSKPFIPSYNIEEDIDRIAAVLWVQSTDCSLNLTTRITFLKHSLALIYVFEYFLDLVLIGFTLQLLASHWISECLLTDYQSVSLGKLIMLHTFDFYIAFEYWMGYISGLRSTKSIPVPSIMMILTFMSTTIHAIAKRQKNIDQLEYSTVRRLNYYLWLIISIIAIAVSSVCKEHQAILLLGCLHEVPQIIQNYLTQTKHQWKLPLFLFLSLPKLVYIGWTLAFSDLILGYKCNITFHIFVGSLILQALILTVQMKRPKIIAKAKSLYRFLNESIRADDDEEICPICLEEPPYKLVEEENKSLKDDSKDKRIIITPCNHQFHVYCLQNWTNQKPSCPCCRCCLPPM